MSAAPRPTVAGVALSSLLASVDVRLLDPSHGGVVVTGVTHDSRSVRAGDLYAALSGFNTHGAQFVDQACDAAAAAISSAEGAGDAMVAARSSSASTARETACAVHRFPQLAHLTVRPSAGIFDASTV